MADTFSTLQQSVSRGGVYRSGVLYRGGQNPPRTEGSPMQPAAGSGGPNRVATTGGPDTLAPAVGSDTTDPVWLSLTKTGPLAGTLLDSRWAGIVGLMKDSDGANWMDAELRGIRRPIDPAQRLTLWLMHDLLVPVYLPPSDLQLLPHGQNGYGNQPGQVYTLDGEPPEASPAPNTLALFVSPGSFQEVAPHCWRLVQRLDASVDRTVNPLEALGPGALSPGDLGVPCGLAADVLTDLFMRQGTVYPGFGIPEHFTERLRTIVSSKFQNPGHHRALSSFDFTAAVVTVEGPVRVTSWLLPTRNAVVLGSR